MAYHPDIKLEPEPAHEDQEDQKDQVNSNDFDFIAVPQEEADERPLKEEPLKEEPLEEVEVTENGIDQLDLLTTEMGGVHSENYTDYVPSVARKEKNLRIGQDNIKDDKNHPESAQVLKEHAQSSGNPCHTNGLVNEGMPDQHLAESILPDQEDQDETNFDHVESISGDQISPMVDSSRNSDLIMPEHIANYDIQQQPSKNWSTQKDVASHQVLPLPANFPTTDVPRVSNGILSGCHVKNKRIATTAKSNEPQAKKIKEEHMTEEDDRIDFVTSDLSPPKVKARSIICPKGALINSIALENGFRCQLCLYETPDTEDLRLHIIVKHLTITGDLPSPEGQVVLPKIDATDFQCQLCLLSCPNRDLFFKHLQAMHTLPNFVCPLCRKMSKGAAMFVQHILSKHNISVMKCLIKTNLGSSMISPFSCNACDFHSENKVAIHTHIMETHFGHQIKMYQCGDCNHIGTIDEAQAHSKEIHHSADGENTNITDNCSKCQLCSYRNPITDELKKHIAIVHLTITGSLPKPTGQYLLPQLGTKNFKCQLCGLKPPNRKLLYRHLQSLHTLPNYSCPLCGKSCNGTKLFMKHIEDAHNISIMKCLTDITYIPGSLLNQFSCNACNFLTKDKVAMVSHLQFVHLGHNLKCYRCGECYQELSSIEEAKIHYNQLHKSFIKIHLYKARGISS